MPDQIKDAGELKKDTEIKGDDSPPVRLSPKDFIIQRQQKKIEKLTDKKDEFDEIDESGSATGEELTSAGRRALNEELTDRLNPMAEVLDRNQINQDITSLYEKYPKSLVSELRKKVETYAQHDAYKNVPVEFIFLGLAGKKLSSASKEDVDKEARENELGGSQRRDIDESDLEGIPDVRKMSDKEVEELAHKVRTGQVKK